MSDHLDFILYRTTEGKPVVAPANQRWVDPRWDILYRSPNPRYVAGRLMTLTRFEIRSNTEGTRSIYGLEAESVLGLIPRYLDNDEDAGVVYDASPARLLVQVASYLGRHLDVRPGMNTHIDRNQRRWTLNPDGLLAAVNNDFMTTWGEVIAEGGIGNPVYIPHPNPLVAADLEEMRLRMEGADPDPEERWGHEERWGELNGHRPFGLPLFRGIPIENLTPEHSDDTVVDLGEGRFTTAALARRGQGVPL